MAFSSRRTVIIIAAALTIGSCTGIRVRPVTYRLKGLVAGPVGHGVVHDGRTRFNNFFCGTIGHMIDVGERWGDCRNYIDIDSTVTPTLGTIKPVRILVVAGVFSECLEPDGVKAFADAKRHLEAATYHQGITVENVSVPALGSSSENAKKIRTYVSQHPGRFIAVGYSKGAGDWMEAIATYSDVRQDVLALVTVAGSVGGSRLPDMFGPEFLKWVQRIMRNVGLPGCQVADAGGIASLTRSDRYAFLQKYPHGAVPSFSIAAVATGDISPNAGDRTISAILQLPWQQMHAYSLDVDSQVIADDAVVPGGTFLGTARADHWAVALPFQDMTDPKKRRRALQVVDRNTYPRTALLEAIVRFIQTP